MSASLVDIEWYFPLCQALLEAKHEHTDLKTHIQSWWGSDHSLEGGGAACPGSLLDLVLSWGQWPEFPDWGKLGWSTHWISPQKCLQKHLVQSRASHSPIILDPANRRKVKIPNNCHFLVWTQKSDKKTARHSLSICLLEGGKIQWQ